MSRLATIVACALLGGSTLVSMGCEQLQSMQSGGEDKSQDESAATAKGEGGGPCEQYASKVCDKAGERSSSCTTLKSASEMMPPEACEKALANVDFTLSKLEEKRAKCDELQAKLCKDIGEETQSCEMVKKQTPNFPAERCQMMLDQYDKVLADLKKREDMNKPLSEEAAKKIATGDAPAFGPEDAKVTIVEFSDFQCPYCAKAADVVEKLREEYGDKVRFVFRQYPLQMHPQADEAAQASLAAAEQGKFWEYHDKLFANQKNLDTESLLKYAKEVGIDASKIEKAVKEEKHAEQIETDKKLGEEVNVRGTPTMFLNGERVSNPTSYELLEKMINKKLES